MRKNGLFVGKEQKIFIDANVVLILRQKQKSETKLDLKKARARFVECWRQTLREKPKS